MANIITIIRILCSDTGDRPLTPVLFDECRRLTGIWREEKNGGSIFVDGRMVAFTYGAAVTNDTLDVCVEKADRNVEGAYYKASPF